VQALDPDSEIALDRALARKDYRAALAELQRLGERRPDRKDIADRVASVMLRAGLKKESFEQLERALRKSPRDAAARLALADARLATGEHAALRAALADAIHAGAATTDLASAIELVEGRTELEPYRLDARKVVAEFEKAGETMQGTAVRVLDYAAVWIHPDGSARMLEHEIVRVQSQEAIGKLSEQRVPSGLVLRVRVLKKDGRVLEPEFVADKPTLTMPHVEVGDYIETESVDSTAGDGLGGMAYRGPHWFFREQDIAYWRSEFVVLSPKDRPLAIEKHGAVPEPVVTEDGLLVARRWRVDRSPAAALEPGSVPIQELLPSVRVGWGITLEHGLRKLVDALSDEDVADPRLRRIAARIVEGVPASAREQRARLVYRWLLANVEKGKEKDGRRVVVGKSGELAFGFLYLTRLLGLPSEVVVVRDRLTEPPVGPMSEAEGFNDFLLRLVTERGELFLAVHDKFAPFGYVPAQLRGQPGFRLVEGTPRVVTGTAGGFDGIVYEGTAVLRANGSASLELSERFVGKFAIGLRRSLEKLPAAELHDTVEAKLLASELPGASLVKVQVRQQDELDKPLTLEMKIEMPDFAKRRAPGLVISPPFAAHVARLASLPERKTPLLISEASRMEVRLRVKLPPGASVARALASVQLRDEDREVLVRDRVEGQDLVLERVFEIPAGRVPVDKYAALQGFARAADEATHQDVPIAIR
jgi:hypothetical protein